MYRDMYREWTYGMRMMAACVVFLFSRFTYADDRTRMKSFSLIAWTGAAQWPSPSTSQTVNGL